MTPEAFKKARKTLGLTQEEMAQALGVSSGETIRRWEKGERGISDTIQILISYLLRDPQYRVRD